MIKATKMSLQGFPAFVEAQDKLRAIGIEAKESETRIGELENELVGTTGVSDLDIEVSQLLDDSNVSVLTDHRVELKGKLRRREVLKRADAKQREIVDGELRKAASQIRSNLKPERRKLVAKVNEAFKGLEAAVTAECVFLEGLSREIRSNEGSSEATRITGLPSNQPAQAFPAILNWRTQMQRLGLLD